jgi:tripartite-type tricarboxylate transporter receptor subunit TctC
MLKTFNRSMRLLALLWCVALIGFAQPVHAQDGAAFYKGKTIKFLVGYGTGGGYDAYARMLAPHFAKAMDATVVVQNQPGAGGLVALNGVYNSPGDGTQIMIVNGTAAGLSQLVGDPNVRYDLTKVSNLGVVSSSPWIWVSGPKSSLTTAQDFLKPGAKPIWGGGGQIDGLSDGAAITCLALKLDCKIVRGYEGSAQVALALARGEVDALYVSDTSANNYVKAGNAKAILTMSRDKSQFFPDLASVFDAVKLTDDQKWWFDFRATLDDLGRILVAPPSLPKEQLAYLQETVRKVLADPEVVAEGAKTNRYIGYRDPAATAKMLGSVLTNITPAQKKTLTEAVMKE